MKKIKKDFVCTANAVVAAAFVSMAAFGGEPLARFGVISDSHVLPSEPHRSEVLRNAFRYMDADRKSVV